MSHWTLETLMQGESIAQRLKLSGMSVVHAAQKSPLFVQSAKALLTAGLSHDTEVMAFFVPGRIEVLGKHTDYAGGRSLTAAVEQGFCVVAVPRTDQVVRVIASEVGEAVEFPFEPSLTPKLGHWSNYPMTVAQRIAQNFQGGLCGADIAFASDLPQAARMSSSSALMIGIFKAIAKVNHLKSRTEYPQNIHNKLELAGYLATIENGRSFGTLTGARGVGTLGGSQDQTAILCSQPGLLGQYSYQPTLAERSVPMPPGYLFAIGSCGVVAEKTGEAMAKYNRASLLASCAAKVWRETTGRSDAHLAQAIRSSPQGVDELRKVLSESDSSEFMAADLIERFDQFFAESEEIIPAIAEALKDPQLPRFGELVDRSQSLAENLLHNQIPETCLLASAARDLGAAAASAFGAGYGGSVWAMVKKSEAEQFLKSWKTAYSQKYPEATGNAAFFLTEAGPPAMEILRDA